MFPKSVSLHLFLWSTGCEWDWTFMSRHYFLWPTGSEPHSIALWKWITWDYFILPHRLSVLLYNLLPSILTHFFNRLWETLNYFQGSLITFHDQQRVSNICSLFWKQATSFFSMTNRQQVTLHWTFHSKSYHISNSLWVTCTFCVMKDISSCMLPYDQQGVSDIGHFCEMLCTLSSFITNRKWVKFHIFFARSFCNVFLTGGEWHHGTFSEEKFYCSLFIQFVSHTINFPETCSDCVFLMINREWVTLFCTAIVSYDPHSLWVDITHFSEGLIRYIFLLCTTGSKCIAEVLCKAVSIHIAYDL